MSNCFIYNNNKSNCYYISHVIILLCFSILLGFAAITCNSIRAFAIKPSCYSYDDVYKNLPKSLQKSDYIINSDGIGKLVLCTNKGVGYDYRSSVKHDGSDFVYCIDYGSHFTGGVNFSSNKTIFSDELRARIALAIKMGPSSWGTKADSGYTTGNFIEDYYMTQMVIHALIHKYGGKLKNQGVDFDNYVFKSGTGNLEKKAKAFYKACCNAIYHDSTGSFQSASFSFNNPANNRLVINADGSAIVSDTILCDINVNNASVIEFKRTASLLDSGNNGVLPDINSQSDNEYNSAFNFSIPIAVLDTLAPGVYTAHVDEEIAFNRVIAKEWFCSTKGYEDNQSLIGYSTTTTNASDNLSMSMVIGAVELVKKDSLTDEYIEDAEFQLLQYDYTSEDYIFYKNLTYNNGDRKYYSGNIYVSANNPEGKFKVIETNPGKSHIKDWPGQEFVLTPDNPVIKIDAKNSPKLGKLKIHKDGEKVTFDKDKGEFVKTNNKTVMPNVKFEVYANEDISFNGTLYYQKNQKIYDIVTDNNGDAIINDVLPGKYYIKESETNPEYILDPASKEFEVKEEDGEYKDITYTFDNSLKNCSISLYKYTKNVNGNNSDNIPLGNCKFGLFAKKDILDPLGNIIVSKDTKLKEAITDSKGMADFKNLIYADYYIKELEVPKGIIISNDIIDVTKNKFELKADVSKEYAASLSIYNEKQKYAVRLLKQGEQFVSAEQKDNDNGAYFEYKMDYKPLKGVTYSIYNSAKEKLLSKESDENGYVEFGPLEYGDYYCIEEAAPKNYFIDSTPIEVSCTELNNDTSDALTQTDKSQDGAAKTKESNNNLESSVKADSDSTNKGKAEDGSSDNKTAGDVIKVDKTVNDTMCDIVMEILKLGEQSYVDNKKLSSTFVPLEGVIYGLYQDFEYSFPSGEKLPANTCVGYITTDSFGKGVFNGKLPEGAYHLQEIKALKGYDIDSDIHSFEITASNNNTIKIDMTKEPFNNYLSKSGVKIIKVDSNSGKKLKGVEFTLYDSNNNVIGVYKTDKKGEITVDNLPYGTYYFIESKAKRGYYSTNNRYNFTLDSNEYKSLEITNTPILKLGFNEHYILYFAIISLILLSGIICISVNGKNKKKDI